MITSEKLFEFFFCLANNINTNVQKCDNNDYETCNKI